MQPGYSESCVCSPTHSCERDPFSKSGLGVGHKDWFERAASGLKQKWDCCQAEDDFEEGDVMDWLEDDEMMRQWEGASKEEEKITVRKLEDTCLQVEGVQKVLELSVSQVARRRTRNVRQQAGLQERWRQTRVQRNRRNSAMEVHQ